jgi:predicted PurR-regulated permease PerM
MNSHTDFIVSRLKLLAILGLFALIFFLREIVLFVFISFIFMTALDPAVIWLEKRFKLSRTWAAAVVVSGCTALVGLVLILTAGSIVNSFQTLPQNLSSGWNAIKSDLSHQSNLQLLLEELNTTLAQQSFLKSFWDNILNISNAVLTAIASVLAFVFLTFYLLIEWPEIVAYFVSFFPKHQSKMEGKIHQIQHQMGSWLRGQLLNMLMVGVVTFIGLTWLGVPNPTALSVLAALFQLIPYVGPTLAAIPAVLIALTVSPNLALAVAIFSLIIQQIETNFVLPILIKQTVHINPVASLLAVVIWAQLLGALGAILAIPLTALLMILAEDLRQNDLQKMEDKNT